MKFLLLRGCDENWFLCTADDGREVHFAWHTRSSVQDPSTHSIVAPVGVASSHVT